MAVISYKRLALDWQPDDEGSKGFRVITVAVLVVVLAIAIAMSFISAPKEERRERAKVPDRIAKFISQREKPPAPIQPPKPKIESKPIPKVEPKPTVERKRPTEVERKPLTETEKKARETAEKSGLLALSNELADLIDTSEVSSQVAGQISNEAAGTKALAGHDANIITSGVAAGGGGVDAGRYTAGVGGTQLEAREIAKLNSGLFAEDEKTKAENAKKAGRSGNGRSEEDVTIVFDRNKGSLYSLYERERRKTPGLQGKIVLQITIAPDGSVTTVKIISSELKNPTLEARLVARIKTFKFTPGNVDAVTVTYPIEFLPS